MTLCAITWVEKEPSLLLVPERECCCAIIRQLFARLPLAAAGALGRGLTSDLNSQECQGEVATSDASAADGALDRRARRAQSPTGRSGRPTWRP